MKAVFTLLSCALLAVSANGQNKENSISKPDATKKIQIVETACGECQLGLQGKSCDLAVRINGKSYFVDGTNIDSHGDAHAKDGFCNSIRKAEVQGEVVDNRFKVTYFKLINGEGAGKNADYTIVSRNMKSPLKLQNDQTVKQDSKIIGSFKLTGTEDKTDYYEFALPSGVTIAKLSFAGGNIAQKFELFTPKDNLRRKVLMPMSERTGTADENIDKNQFTLERISKWLVDNHYM